LREEKEPLNFDGGERISVDTNSNNQMVILGVNG
jgi:hypothetical protein